MAKAQAEWIEIDPSTLPEVVQGAYRDYKARYASMKAARLAFEAAMAQEFVPPSGKRLAFGYNFGKLSVAVVEDDRKAPKAGGSLAEYLARQAREGRQC